MTQPVQEKGYPAKETYYNITVDDSLGPVAVHKSDRRTFCWGVYTAACFTPRWLQQGCSSRRADQSRDRAQRGAVLRTLQCITSASQCVVPGSTLSLAVSIARCDAILNSGATKPTMVEYCDSLYRNLKVEFYLDYCCKLLNSPRKFLIWRPSCVSRQRLLRHRVRLQRIWKWSFTFSKQVWPMAESYAVVA